MNNYLNFDYVFWLQKFQNTSNDCTVRAITKHLIAELPKAQSVAEVLSLLEQFIPEKDDSIRDEVCLYGPVNLYAQLLKWHTELDFVLKTSSAIRQRLHQLELNSELLPLIRFLNYLLQDAKQLLHGEMSSLIKILNKESLPDILNFIGKLEVIPLPTNPLKGSFTAIKPVNEDHAACIAFLHNLSAKFDEKNKLWTQANSLLQTSLLIYKDMLLEEVVLNNTQQVQSKGGWTMGCMLS